MRTEKQEMNGFLQSAVDLVRRMEAGDHDQLESAIELARLQHMQINDLLAQLKSATSDARLAVDTSRRSLDMCEHMLAVMTLMFCEVEGEA